MRISPGGEWGTSRRIPDDLPIVGSDAEAAALFREGCRFVGLAGGDICRTMGGRGDVVERRGTDAVVCPVDVGVVSVDGGADHLFLAHVVACGRLGSGDGAVVMNAEWWGRRRLGPRAHPGDGLLDVTTGRLGWRDRLMARRRSLTGDHLPHPALVTRRVATTDLVFARPRRVRVDGVIVGRGRRLEVRLLPEQLLVVV